MKLRTKAWHQFIALEGDPVPGIVPVGGLVAEGKEIQQEAPKVAQELFGRARMRLRIRSIASSELAAVSISLRSSSNDETADPLCRP